ncbi:MAG: cytochrome c-type biogenesis protein CcmH [Chloroflexi bacterium]|nr:cytochrome c-type biogenesis protein CcmH [Chloroflexota bacterium]MCI0578360.1 cytochrome c-type biogenesis protein CcmH [Chloroflexota bacterium]MCI0646237.1 cytochrome c-type biogenesis protein CcmH [Chloroflexota bacterium]MCI0732143.1 cytochrome c-type biogenesis protein CcmH [Chloroflexota bacterium]
MRLTTDSKTVRAIALALLGLLLVLAAVPAVAQEQQPTRVVTADEVNAVARDLFCPVCESTPLDVCPTQACADWREVIRTKLSQGQSPEEIRAYFAEQYGVRALAEPPREGFSLGVWIAPIAGVAIGAFLFSRYLRRIRAAAPATTAAGPPPAIPEPPRDDYQARIEQELQERFGS